MSGRLVKFICPAQVDLCAVVIRLVVGFVSVMDCMFVCEHASVK